TIPNSVTSIEDRAFSGCPLTSVTINSDVIMSKQLNKIFNTQHIIIGSNVTSIGDGAFYDFYALKLVTIPNSVTSIGQSAFGRCSSLTSVTIPNSVTSIGDRAFSGCTGLTSVTVPNSVTSIGDYAFSECSGLTSIKYLCRTPRAFPDLFYCYNDIIYEKATLYVPKGCSVIIKNQQIEPWNKFRNIEELPATDVNIDDAVNTADVVAVYTRIIDGSEEDEEIVFEDVNNDGNVNTADVVAIYDYIINGNDTDQ
ncbi:MAG: leucine-rich repeat protein, partial [Bacteroidaceae bacterium]|nr:leucine-rich repeat protein [Bacteroidaceae bacterium]